MISIRGSDAGLQIERTGSADPVVESAIECIAFPFKQTRFHFAVKRGVIVIAVAYIEERHRFAELDIPRIIDFQRVKIGGKTFGTEIEFVSQGKERLAIFPRNAAIFKV